MSVGRKKPVRWTIPDVKGAPPRRLEACTLPRGAQETPGTADRPYPSVSDLMRGTYTRGWLEGALRAVLGPVAVASAMSMGATGCADVSELFAGEADFPSVYGDGTERPPATLTPIGPPDAANRAFSLPAAGPASPSKPPVGSSPHPEVIPPCPLPPPAPNTGPEAHPPQLRGGRAEVRPAPPPSVVLPAVDPPLLDGDTAVVRPQPPAMPGGLRAVRPAHDGGS